MRIPSKRVFVGVVAASMMFLFAGCGNLAEKAIEKTVEKQTGTDIKTDKDGNVTIKGKDGEGDFQFGTGTSMPKDFPKDVPLPKSGKLLASSATPGAWGLTFEGVSASDYGKLLSQIESQGASSTYSGEADGSRQNMFELDDYNLTLFWGSDGEETSLIYSVGTKSS